jgi:hypothetical protein
MKIPDYRDPKLAFNNALQSGVFHETLSGQKSYNFVGNWMYMHSDECEEKLKDYFKNIDTREYISVEVI